jgi:hypothetical protein
VNRSIETSPTTPRSETRLDYWDTREPLPEDFREAWAEALEGAEHAHFALDLGFLAWEARLGRRSRAVLARQRERTGVVVLRWEGNTWVSGWPWRWQALARGARSDLRVGLSAADARWLHAECSRVVSPSSVRLFLPHPPADGVAGWRAGSTILQELLHDDDELLAGMEPSKRRLARRARALDLEVSVARGHEEFRAFHRLQQEVRARRGLPQESTREDIPDPGSGWREWELPWMMLLVARRSGQVISGLGDGTHAGGLLDARTSASTMEARSNGANVLLGLTEASVGRELGHRWLNHGGDTAFKREMSGRFGQRVTTFGWLGGSPRWRIFHFGEAAVRRVRPGLARLRRRLGGIAAAAAVFGACRLGDALPWAVAGIFS